MRKKKNQLNKKAKESDASNEDKQKASEAIQMFNYMSKLQKEKDLTKLAQDQEKAYRKDFWTTARDVTNGSFGKPRSKPTFDKCTADQHYKDKYEKEVQIDLEGLSWFPKVEAPSAPYNLSAYTPKDIRQALYKKCNNSAPGEDGIVYAYLKKMPYIHKVLATAFTGIRDKGEAPDSWAKSKVILLKKDESDSDDDPKNFRMISLTMNIGKLYHSLEAQRTIDFMVANKYLDPVAQKAYVEGINGCVEHVTVVQEIIQHAKLNHKTVHITWFDLEDAFGSVCHVLIPFVMKHYYIPTQITKYIESLYSKLRGKVVSQDWESDFFRFLKGVFQGDPLSGVIFLIVFNPIVEYIKSQKEKQGYQLTSQTNAMYVNTTPFADDFNVISRNIKQHQTLVLDVEKKLQSMGLVLKAPKCRSLSIQSGKTTNIQFHLKTNTNKVVPISSVIEKPMKFLGSVVQEDNSPHAMFATLSQKLQNKLENIDKSSLRGEYKANIYVRYALPSLRYFMSVHRIHKTHEEKLDSLAKKYLKKWYNIQKNGVTDISIFHPYLLGIKAPSQVYQEAHTSTYTMIRLKGDKVVNQALDSRLGRESAWTNKSSTIVKADGVFKKNIENKKITFPTEESESEKKALINKAKREIRRSIQEKTKATWNNKVNKLLIQGDFASLLIEEEANITWKSFINNTPRGVLSFALKASVNGLPTPDNLKRWGVKKMDKCVICGNFANLEHVLNWCKTSLNDGRFKWRHDSILNYMTKEMKKGAKEEISIFTDIPGQSINGGTLPPDIVVTGQRPDIVIINRTEKKIVLFELTVSFEKNVEAANLRKSRRYMDLTSDLVQNGWHAENIPFEIGSRGHIDSRNKTSIFNVMKKYNINIKKKPFIEDISKISLLCSFALFQAHCQPSWQSPPYLHP